MNLIVYFCVLLLLTFKYIIVYYIPNNKTKAPWKFNRLCTLNVIYLQSTDKQSQREHDKMTDHELLLAMSDLIDKKLDAKLEPIKDDIKSIKDEQTRINLIIENEIQHDIQLLAENYLPAAKRYEKATAQIEAMQADIDIMKKVITEHSEKLQKLA